MVINEPQDMLAEYLCSALKYTPTKHLVCLGRWSLMQNKLIGVVGFDLWSSAAVEMHVAGERGFVSKQLLYMTFAYPFIEGNVNVVIGRVNSNNTAALRFNTHLGFKEMCRIPNGASKGGDLVVMAMQKHECRWLKLGNNELKKVA